jgi:hypothetical protein
MHQGAEACFLGLDSGNIGLMVTEPILVFKREVLGFENLDIFKARDLLIDAVSLVSEIHDLLTDFGVALFLGHSYGNVHDSFLLFLWRLSPQ